MGRRTRLIIVLAVAAALAALGGALVAVSMGGSGGAAPTGGRTVLRVQAEDDTVSCGGGPVPVYLYLDDLEARISPADAPVSYGMAGFSVLLRYDPAIVRIERPIDIALNARLQEDPDGDGVARSFFPVSNVDDGAGLALLGAASLVATGRPEDQREEGADPAAKGEPLLLMTVRFLAVGHGTTALTIEPSGALHPALDKPRLLDPSGTPYEPFVLQNGSLTVEGGECPAGPFATPRPTAGPTATAFVPPTITPVPWRTVTPQDAAAVGRTDCPEAWVAYRDAQDRYSLCYPADFSATVSDFALNANSPYTRGQESAMGIVVSWSAGAGYFYGPPSPETCSQYTNIVEGPLSSDFVELTVSGRQVAACFTVGPIQSSLHGSFPLADDGSDREGFINFAVNFIDPDLSRVPAEGQSIIETLRVNFR